MAERRSSLICALRQVKGKKSRLSGYLAIYSDITHLFSFPIAIGGVQVWLGNMFIQCYVLFFIAKDYKGIKA